MTLLSLRTALLVLLIVPSWAFVVKTKAPPPPSSGSSSTGGRAALRRGTPPTTTTTLHMSFASSSSGNSLSKAVPRPPTARRPSVESGLRYRSDDWLGNFISIPNSFVLRRIRFHLVSNTLLTAATCLSHYYFRPIRIPMVGHSLLGSFLGLLLVFRTNSAYARFWQARAVWTSTLSTCRNMALVLANYIQPHAPVQTAQLFALLAAYPDVLTHACLSGQTTLPDPVKELLAIGASSKDDSDNDNDLLEPATVLLYQMHKIIHEAAKQFDNNDYLAAMHLADVSHCCSALSDAVSKADTIVRTPVPLSYSRHTSRFLTIWTGTLPFALIGQLGVLTLPVTAVACWCLLGIEEIGHLIEQPFVGDKTAGDKVDPTNTSFLALAPLVRRAAKTQPYDIGLPVFALGERVKKQILSIAATANITV